MITGEHDGQVDGWAIVARSDEVAPGPIARVVGGRSVVVWRAGNGRVSVLEDACPHQGNPLSTGSVSGNQLWCRHHGWAVGTDGWCERAAAGADSFRVRESEGVVLARDPRS